MAAPASHLAEARANRAHAQYLLAHHTGNPTALRWAVTAAFYAAVHGMEAYLAGMGQTGENHKKRKQLLRDPAHGVPMNVYQAYRRLEDASHGARYLVRQFTPDDVRRLLNSQLATVAQFVGFET